MDPKLPNEELLQITIYDYFKKRNLLNLAEALQRETRLNEEIPNTMERPPHGYLYNLWSSLLSVFDKPPYKQWVDRALAQENAVDDAAAINTIPRILREKYCIRHLEGFESGQTLLSCDISSDGNIVASGGNGMKPFICFVGTRHSVASVESHSSTILDVRFQPGTNIFATASADTTVKLWDANKPTTALSDFVGHNWRVRSLDFHPSGRFLCSSDAEDVIKVWDVNQQVLFGTHEVGGSKVRFQPGSGSLLAVANRNVIAILDSSSYKFLYHLMGHDNDIYSMCWDVTGSMIASVSDDGVRVWSVLKNGQCLYNYRLSHGRFQSVIFHPRYNDVLVVGGFMSLEVLILEKAKICIARGPSLSINGLAATTAQSECIASVSNQSNSVVNIWK